MPYSGKLTLAALRPTDRRIHDLMRFMNDGKTNGVCSIGISVRDLPLDCKEVATTPGLLFDKLNDWGHETIVIPHGTAWGAYTPPGADWMNQLNEMEHDPNIQTMIEVYSGHGSSEEYRDWRSVLFDEEGKVICPKPTPKLFTFLLASWRDN